MAQTSGNRLAECAPKFIADCLLRNGIDSLIAPGVARYNDSLRPGRLSRFGLHSACAVFESSLGRQLLLKECSWLLGCALVILYTEMGIGLGGCHGTGGKHFMRSLTLFLSSITSGDQMRCV